MWTILFVAGATDARAECTFRATPERLDAALDAAEKAYVSLDVPEFERAMTEVDFVVPCLERPVTPAVAARLHRMRGLGRFAAGDRLGAEASLRAARRLDPAYTFSEELLPKGFELRDLYEALPADPAVTDRLARPAKDASTFLDGTATRERPTDAPAVWQLQRDGAVAQTLYLEPTEPTPWYPGANKDQLPWLVGAGATGLAAAVTYGVAAGMERRVTAPQPGDAGFADQGALDAHQAATNALVVTSAGLATGALVELAIGAWKGGRE